MTGQRLQLYGIKTTSIELFKEQADKAMVRYANFFEQIWRLYITNKTNHPLHPGIEDITKKFFVSNASRSYRQTRKLVETDTSRFNISNIDPKIYTQFLAYCSYSNNTLGQLFEDVLSFYSSLHPSSSA